MAVARLLDQGEGTDHLRNGVEQRRRQRAAGDGDPRGRVAVDQRAQYAGGQDGVAQPVGGDEKDVHAGRLGGR